MSRTTSTLLWVVAAVVALSLLVMGATGGMMQGMMGGMGQLMCPM